MSFAPLESGTPQRYALIQQNVIAQLGGLADDNAHAMVDEKPVADGGSRMDLNAGQKTRELGNQTRHDKPAPLVKPRPPTAAAVCAVTAR